MVPHRRGYSYDRSVSGTSVVAELKTEKYSDLENKLNKIKEENPDSFIGWA